MERQTMKAKTLDLITEQLTRSRHKYPQNEHLLTAAFESMGSLARALLCGKDEHPETVKKEAAQAIAILVRLIEEGDATFKGWPRPRRD